MQTGVILLKNFKNELYIRNLYIRASQTVMDQNMKTVRQYINHINLVNCLKNILKHSGRDEITICDCHDVFFDMLCKKVLASKHKNDIAVCVANPCYSGFVICQMYIPRTESVFINKISTQNRCKDIQLYTTDLQLKTAHNTLIAQKLYQNSKKQQ